MIVETRESTSTALQNCAIARTVLAVVVLAVGVVLLASAIQAHQSIAAAALLARRHMRVPSAPRNLTMLECTNTFTFRLLLTVRDEALSCNRIPDTAADTA